MDETQNKVDYPCKVTNTKQNFCDAKNNEGSYKIKKLRQGR